MALDFPSSPTVGQLFPTPAVAGVPVWKWDGFEWTPTSVQSSGTSTFAQYEYVATAGQTSFGGADINGITLAYVVGYVAVFVNGDRLNKADYVATNGVSIVFAIGRSVLDQITVVTLNVGVITNALLTSNNLSDLTNAVAARNNLGMYNNASFQSGVLGGLTFTTPAPGTMGGYGSSVKITPVTTGRVLVTMQSNITTTGIGGMTATASLRYGTGTAPASGAAPAGTSVGAGSIYQPSTANYLSPMHLSSIITGLALGVPIWFDVLCATPSGQTGTLNTLSATVMEF